MPHGNHRTKHNQTQRHRRGNSNRRQTRKNRTTTPRTTTPFDLESELRNRERWKRMQNLSTNPFGRTAKERYEIDITKASGEVMSRLASRLEEKRERRRRKGKDPFTQQERDLREKTQEAFLKEAMNLKPNFWDEKAWEQELRDVMDPKTDVMDPRRESPSRIIDLEPITELTITEVDEVPLSLEDASLYSRRKSRKAEGNTKRKRKRKKKKHATQKRKRKRKRKRKKR